MTSRKHILAKILSLSFLAFLLRCDHANGQDDIPKIWHEANPGLVSNRCEHPISPNATVHEDCNGKYSLVVDVDVILPKSLSVDVDYEAGVVSVFGKVAGALDTCLYRAWILDSEVHEIIDVTMQRKEDKVIIALPKRGQEQAVPLPCEEDSVSSAPPAQPHSGLRGLPRLWDLHATSRATRSVGTTNLRTSNWKKANWDNLQRFLEISLENTDEEAYWLHRM